VTPLLLDIPVELFPNDMTPSARIASLTLISCQVHLHSVSKTRPALTLMHSSKSTLQLQNF